MSILIKGMEMPKDIEPGLVIEFADGIDGKRYARLYHYRHGGLTEWLEAVPIPPHGRLIDADELIKNLEVSSEGGNNGAALLRAAFLEVLKAAPTIIPAEPCNNLSKPCKEDEQC